MSVSTVLAKALFDNAAESPEELAFRKGDILMVLEQEQGGGPGWWLCSLHGRQGIAPANRLKLLQTAPPPGSDPRRGSAEDPVYLSPVPPMSRAEDVDGVYRSPPGVGEPRGAAPRPGELRRAEGGRPRSHSSSGLRPRPDWDLGVGGRPRSPSLRGRGAEATGTLYHAPGSPLPSGAPHARPTGALAAPESVYLAPTGVPRAADEPEDTTYLVPRKTLTAAASDDCYLVPKGTPLAGDDVYQSPTGGVCPSGPSGTPGTPQLKGSQDTPAMYQTPTPVGASLHRTSATVLAHQHPSPLSQVQASPRALLKGGPPSPAVARGKPGMAAHRGSPLLGRAGKVRVPGSPNFARKPPPPAPPVRGVTKKEAAQSADSSCCPRPNAQVTSASPQQAEDKPTGGPESKGDGTNGVLERSNNALNKRRDAPEYSDHADDQVYDTPPSGRWQRPVPSSHGEDDDGIYDTPRCVPPQADSETEVYDVPTIILNPDVQPEEVEEDVYSVPTLPGVPLGPGEPAASLPGEDGGHLFRVPGSEKRVGGGGGGPKRDSSEPDRGIYDMPAISAEVLPHSASSSSSSTSTRRLSVSSNGSGDVQWRATLSGLVHSVLGAASGSAALPSRELAASLAEILSTWKACHADDPPPPLQQAWARLSDLLPALAAVGAAPPSEGLLTLVQRSLEESALLLQAQGRPRLPSQDSLSRRPLPALPLPDGKPAGGGGMGSRKGSWIQERPLPPTPQPAFPLPPTLSPVTLTIGGGEDDPSNEYAGIGLTPIPPPAPTGDSVGYVKLQGKPEPLPDILCENGHMQTINADPTLTPSPPLPLSLSLEDSELLSFYSSQSLAHLSCLADAIDVLFSSVQGNQPPRVFVARGKSLIVTAHKLVFIGDTLSRLLTSADLRAKITTSGGRLCQALKSVVVATKGAAQNYPSLSATQEMVDRVAELSQQAAGFSTLLQRLAEISS
ncbi:embryonal Fyn-associated substrate [Pungitius pungitius]|uniref:embryonal Fyn-associated substrate n=1 Tax=Pungitius pungitius TaxID=134920 RepID=UPI002E104F25